MVLRLGPPGGLVALPDPDPGVEVPWSRTAVEHRLLSGARVLDMVGAGRRAFTFSWTRLTDEEFGRLEEFATGARGRGPFLLVTDDIRWNYLTSVQASATSVTGDVTGWSVTGGEALTSIATGQGPVLRGPRSLRWSLPSPTTSGRLVLTAPAGLLGWPAVPDLGWTFSVAAQASPGRGIPLTVAAVLRWFDAAGAELAVTAGPATTIPPSAFEVVAVSAVRPAGAVWLLPELHVEPASVTTATFLYVDEPLLEPGDAVRAWLPGRGQPRVTIADLTLSHPWADTLDSRAVLVEVT